MKPAHLPSVSDIVSISRIPTTTAPASAPPLAALLSPLLTLLRTADVRSYLLSPQPHHVPTLLSPTLPATSHLFSTVATRASPLIPAPLTSFVSHFDIHFLYAPALCLSNVVVGAGIMNSRSMQCPLSLPTLPSVFLKDLAPEFCLFRFAVDPAQNLVLMLYAIPSRDAFLVFYSQVTDTRTSSSVCLIFSHSHLLPFLNPDPDSPLTAQHLALAVLHYTFQQARHPCQVCSRTDEDGPCACALTYDKPMHPLDTFPFVSLMRPHTGKLELTCHEASVRHGRVLSMEVLGVRETFEGFVDADVRNCLVDGALRKYFEGILAIPGKGLSVTLATGLLESGEDGGAQSSPTHDDSGLLRFDALPLPSTDGILQAVDDDSGTPTTDESRPPPITAVELDVTKPPVSSPVQLTTASIKPATAPAPESRAHVWARRRERNRLAAKRSNLKRKMQLESLQTQLDTERDKITKLRARELALRKENLGLRGSCK